MLMLLASLVGCGHNGQRSTATESAAEASPANPYFASRGMVGTELTSRFERGNGYLQAGELERAEADFRWIIARRPELSGPYLNMAVIYLQRLQPELSEQYFEQALRANPQNPDAHNRYAIYLREAGRLREAEQQYLAALAIWQGHSATHHNLAVLYDLYLGEQEQALVHYVRYQQLSGSESRQLAGWIADLQRQVSLVAQEGGGYVE
jgi:Tfp pilus assembly protein PilF